MDLVLPEFDRQAERLLDPALADCWPVPRQRLVGGLTRLRKEVAARATEPRSGNVPLCVIVGGVLRVDRIMAQVVTKKARGTVDMTPVEPGDFRAVDGLELPAADVYALWDVDTGHARLGVTPAASLVQIRAAGRTALTLNEGVLLALLVPDLLVDKQRFNAVQMAASRIADDRRVPSLWFSKGAPRLGWCWDGNPHGWMATACAAARLTDGIPPASAPAPRGRPVS